MKALRAIPLPVWKRCGRIVLLTVCAFLTSQEAPSQDYKKAFLLKRGDAQTQPSFSQRAIRSFPDTVHALAIMVDFQPDTDLRTTGDGKFSLLPTTQRVMDPPPHDSAYFANKLLFLENYFRKSSNGKLIVTGEVFGQTITLSKQMSSFAPSRDGSNDRPLADLVVESWRKADSLYPAIDFRRYDAFIIFHAGVGRDIDLVSLLGFDPTPNDIPSLYVGLSSLRKFLNDPSFAGVPVENGAVRITNTIILPETESRIISSGAALDTLQLGINGLLVSSFGSYLGLPDLFDTKTGRSAIGQFGLMDVASIFAFDGLFPPEPSAWEKIFLGWAEPITVNAGSLTVSLPAVGLTATGSDTIYKVPVSAREYFLIENRNRDPQRNGQRLTIVEDGRIITRYFSADTTGFVFSDGRGITGSLIDVEDFDWALPGLISANDTVEGGGVLIWHIDEDVINRKIAANEVNADTKHRGVALEEADGSLDIGQDYGIFDPGLGSQFGSPFDCFFQQNPVEVYRNIFERNSIPNSNSNSGARSIITIKEFSRRSPRMTATIQVGDQQFQRLSAFSRTIGASPAATHPTVSSSGIFLGNGRAVFAFQRTGFSKTKNPSGLFSSAGGQFGIAVLDLENGENLLVGAEDSSLFIWNAQDRNGDGVYDSVRTVIVPLKRKATTAPTFADVFLKRSIVIGGDGGIVLEVSFDGMIEREIQSGQAGIASMTQLPTPNLSRPTQLFSTSGGQIFSEQLSFSLGDNQQRWLLASSTSPSGAVVVAAQLLGNVIVGVDQSLSKRVFQTTLTDGSIRSLAIADLDLDGNKDILVNAGQKLFALNRSGAVVDGFPVVLPGDNRFVGSPLLGDVDGDGKVDVVSLTSYGTTVIYDESGRMKEGLPLQTLTSGDGSMALFATQNNKVGLVAVSTLGEMQAWELGSSYNASTIFWQQHLHDAQLTNSEQSFLSSPKPKTTEFFPKSLVYNWPNPVYGNSTQIRFFVSENVSVTVRIFDLAGSQVTELKGQGGGGIDNEMTWDVSGIQSGVYLAHVEVNGAGKTESAVIKIAVVK